MGDFYGQGDEVIEAHSLLWRPSDRVGGLTPVPREGTELALPDVGSTYWNSRGMEFLVLKHTSISPEGKRIEPSNKPGHSLERLVTTPVKTDVPVVAARGFSDRLLQLWEEFEAVCPKPTAILDMAFADPLAQMRFGGHSISWLADPRAAVLTIDSRESDEDTIAHELMHGWLDLVRGYEDHRMYRDLDDHATKFLVDSTQCMVLDCMVQEAIGARGFDSCHWTTDYINFMYENAVGLHKGVYPVSRYEASFAARLYALPEAVPHLFRLAPAQVAQFIFARNAFRDKMPDLARLGDSIVEAFRSGSYRTTEDAQRLIDRCLMLTAEYVGIGIDLDRDLAPWRPPEPEYMDKFPDMLPRFPVQLKYAVNRRLLRENWPAGTLIQATAIRGASTVQVRFVPPADSPKVLPATTWEWESPQPLALPAPQSRFRDPMEALAARFRPRSRELLQMGNQGVPPHGRAPALQGPGLSPAAARAMEQAGLARSAASQADPPQPGLPQRPSGQSQPVIPGRMHYVEPEIPGMTAYRRPVPGTSSPAASQNGQVGMQSPPSPAPPKPPASNLTLDDEPFSPRRRGRTMRHYLPGLGRFISRVHLHQAVAMGRATYRELRDVWGINIGPLGTPEAFARNGVLEHPYSYAENRPLNMIDPSGLWCIHLPGHRCIGTTCHGDPCCKPAKPKHCAPNPQVPTRVDQILYALKTAATYLLPPLTSEMVTIATEDPNGCCWVGLVNARVVTLMKNAASSGDWDRYDELDNLHNQLTDIYNRCGSR